MAYILIGFLAFLLVARCGMIAEELVFSMEGPKEKISKGGNENA